MLLRQAFARRSRGWLGASGTRERQEANNGYQRKKPGNLKLEYRISKSETISNDRKGKMIKTGSCFEPFRLLSLR